MERREYGKDFRIPKYGLKYGPIKKELKSSFNINDLQMYLAEGERFELSVGY